MAVLRRTAEAIVAWRKLAKPYRYERSFMGRTVHSVSFYIGPVNFGPLITFKVSPRGLYMAPPPLLSLVLPPVCLNWVDLRVVKYVRAPLFRGYAVIVGTGDAQVEIRLPDRLIQAARLYITVPESERAERATP